MSKREETGLDAHRQCEHDEHDLQVTPMHTKKV